MDKGTFYLSLAYKAQPIKLDLKGMAHTTDLFNQSGLTSYYLLSVAVLLLGTVSETLPSYPGLISIPLIHPSYNTFLIGKT